MLSFYMSILKNYILFDIIEKSKQRRGNHGDLPNQN